MLPVPVRRRIFAGSGTSHAAFDAIKYTGGGWKAFWFYALPRLRPANAVTKSPFDWSTDPPRFMSSSWNFETASGLFSTPSIHGGPFDWDHYK